MVLERGQHLLELEEKSLARSIAVGEHGKAKTPPGLYSPTILPKGGGS